MTQTTTPTRGTPLPTAFIERPTLWARTEWARIQLAWLGQEITAWVAVMYVLGAFELAHEANHGQDMDLRFLVGLLAVLVTLGTLYELVRWWSHDPRTEAA